MLELENGMNKISLKLFRVLLIKLSWSSAKIRNFSPREVAQRGHESQEVEVDPGNAGRRMQKGGRPVASPWIYFRYIGDIWEICLAWLSLIGWLWGNSPSLEVGRECWLPRRWRAPSSRGSTIGLTSPPPPSRPPPPPPRQSAWVHLLMDRTVDEQSQRCPRHSDWGARVQTAPPCHSEGKGWLPDEWKIAQMGSKN